MRRRLFAVPMLLLCLLCACAGQRTESLQAPVDFRARLIQAGGCGLRLEGTADVGERVYAFTLDCVCGADGSAELTVLAPETLAEVIGAGRGIQEIGIAFCREINTDGAGTNDLSHFLAH